MKSLVVTTRLNSKSHTRRHEEDKRGVYEAENKRMCRYKWRSARDSGSSSAREGRNEVYKMHIPLDAPYRQRLPDRVADGLAENCYLRPLRI